MNHPLPAFDKLREMAEKDPDALERLRITLSMECINAAPAEHRHRLQGLLFRIEMERRRAKTPMQSCLRLSALMHDTFHQLNDALQQFCHNHASRPLPTAVHTATRARVLQFIPKYGPPSSEQPPR